jgi:ribosomal protein L11 methyltransferase
MTGAVKQKWFAVVVTVAAEAVEAVESALNVLGTLGTETGLLTVKGGPLVVSGYFDAPPGAVEIRDAVDSSLRIHGFSGDVVTSIETRTVEETDWLAEWKKYWRATTVGVFIIAPPWEKVAALDKIVVSIEPNMAFGTGTHETTQLCLKAIGELYRPGESFLDVGTGTGILAIAAAGLQAKSTQSKVKILACDTDADSVRIAIENARLNGVSERIEFFVGSVDDQTPAFDLVCANLTVDVIVPILPLLLAKTRSVLLLSGILAEQQEQIEQALSRTRVSDVVVERAGEWISVIVRP